MFYFLDTKNGENKGLPIAAQVLEILKTRKIERNALLFLSQNDKNTPRCFRSTWKSALNDLLSPILPSMTYAAYRRFIFGYGWIFIAGNSRSIGA